MIVLLMIKALFQVQKKERVFQCLKGLVVEIVKFILE